MTGISEAPSNPDAEVPASNRVVVFADMLGFAALTEANPIDAPTLRSFNRPLSVGLAEISRGAANPLTTAFSRFHQSLKWALMAAQFKHALTAITFSDSVFVATKYLFEATRFASEFCLKMLLQKVPVRIGIGYGSFAALGFRSDVSFDGGDHAAQFLRAAVVRSCQAEKCGIKGMRILLHPSVEPLFSDASHNPGSLDVGILPFRRLECPEQERENSTGVHFQVNYWNLAATKERTAWHALQDMWEEAPSDVQTHYIATSAAVDRMRRHQGEAPLVNFRRRTLPRRPR